MRSSGKKLFTSLIFAILVFIPVLIFSDRIVSREINSIYALPWALFAGATAFAIFHTGKVSFFRRIFFSVSALTFLIHFKLSLASQIFSASCFKDTPYCHIAVAPSFLNYLYQQYLALMSGNWKLWGPLSLVFIWLFATLAIGRAWCSWACFYGGIDDGLSALAKKPLLNTTAAGLKVRDFASALLIFLLLISFANMLPVYCLWLCPFKMTEAFLDTDHILVRKIQHGLMALSLTILIIGPLLTKKRTFCSFLCPFGAWQAFWGKINPFRVTIDAEKCTGCRTCINKCPSYAIQAEPGARPDISSYCTLCGECLGHCPAQAIKYSVLGIKTATIPEGFGKLLTPETFLIFSALTLGATFSSLWAPAALCDILKLFKQLFLF